MNCPHCGTDAVFEATEDYSYRPTIERWEFDNPVNQAEGLRCICTSCDMFVTIDVRNRYIKITESERHDALDELAAQAQQLELGYSSDAEIS